MAESMQSKQQVMEALRTGKSLKDFPEFQNDYETVHFTLGLRGHEFRHASSKLKNDRSLVLLAASKYGQALLDAPRIYRKDQEILLAAAKQHPFIIYNLPKETADNKEVVMMAVSRNGHVLRFASDRLKNDKAIVLAALNEEISAYKHVSSEIQELIGSYGQNNALRTFKWFIDAEKIPCFEAPSTYFKRTDLVHFHYH